MKATILKLVALASSHRTDGEVIHLTQDQAEQNIAMDSQKRSNDTKEISLLVSVLGTFLQIIALFIVGLLRGLYLLLDVIHTSEKLPTSEAEPEYTEDGRSYITGEFGRW